MSFICGMDEVGRGPLAGPVTAGAVILPEDFPVAILADSKKLTEKKRLAAVDVIMEKAAAWGIGWVWPFEIDKINILNASLLAMKRAWENMNSAIQPEIILVDGIFVPEIDTAIPMEAIIKGDDKIHEIMAASILAKTMRDLWMTRYSWIEAGYGFEKHKGYPTKAHRNSIKNNGLSFIHRRSFRLFSDSDF